MAGSSAPTPDDACSIVMPVGRQGLPAVPVAGPLSGLTGRRLAVIDITKVRSEVFAEELAQALRGAGAATVDRYLAAPSQRMGAEELHMVGTECDGAVLALADCGTCTSWTLHDAIELHRLGCRAVVVTTHDLRPMVAALAPRLGMAALPVVSVPLANREHQADGIRATARAVAGDVIDALTSEVPPLAGGDPTGDFEAVASNAG
jgi:hypothetical protein